jgi:hypothetical protein
MRIWPPGFFVHRIGRPDLPQLRILQPQPHPPPPSLHQWNAHGIVKPVKNTQMVPSLAFRGFDFIVPRTVHAHTRQYDFHLHGKLRASFTVLRSGCSLLFPSSPSCCIKSPMFHCGSLWLSTQVSRKFGRFYYIWVGSCGTSVDIICIGRLFVGIVQLVSLEQPVCYQRAMYIDLCL